MSTYVVGDIQGEPLAKPVAFPPDFAVQRHDMDDPLYAIRAKLR